MYMLVQSSSLSTSFKSHQVSLYIARPTDAQARESRGEPLDTNGVQAQIIRDTFKLLRRAQFCEGAGTGIASEENWVVATGDERLGDCDADGDERDRSDGVLLDANSD